jgi:hypothetical protein
MLIGLESVFKWRHSKLAEVDDLDSRIVPTVEKKEDEKCDMD